MREGDSDSEEEDEVCNVKDEEQAYEDCSMPKIAGEGSEVAIPVKVLVDSGSMIDIISSKLAKRLMAQNVVAIRTAKMRIIVANGNKNIIDKAMKLSLHIGGVKSDISTFIDS